MEEPCRKVQNSNKIRKVTIQTMLYCIITGLSSRLHLHGQICAIKLLVYNLCADVNAKGGIQLCRY